jgi:hypothetical protein
MKEGLALEGDYLEAEISKLPFDVKAIERNSAMVGFGEIFPATSTLSTRMDGAEYVIFDQYCVNSSCTCHAIGLDFIPSKNGKLSGHNQQFLFDYENWQLDALSPIRAEFPAAEALAKGMRLHKPGMAKRLKLRHEAIRKVYSLYRKGIVKTSARSSTPALVPRVGRNDPCPCGSGKKYKRCHGA